MTRSVVSGPALRYYQLKLGPLVLYAHLTTRQGTHIFVGFGLFRLDFGLKFSLWNNT